MFMLPKSETDLNEKIQQGRSTHVHFLRSFLHLHTRHLQCTCHMTGWTDMEAIRTSQVLITHVYNRYVVCVKVCAESR